MRRAPLFPGRRRVLKAVLVLVPAAAFAQQKKRVEENEPQAQALGYTHDASKVDRQKYPNHQPDQTCANCNFFKGAQGAAWGPCDIFAGREVSAKGWCSAWVKKA